MLKKKRIFIKYLPQKATANELEDAFAEYGSISSVDIKQRKNFDSSSHESEYFAYVNIEIDDVNLQKCFEAFRSNLWHGEYVELQIAKENFLEQLKREREESKKVNNKHNEVTHDTYQEKSSFNNDCTKPAKAFPKIDITKNNRINVFNGESNDLSTGNRNLTIQSDKDVNKNENDKDSSNLNLSEVKRSQRVYEMIQGYHQQKLIIKSALSNIDVKSNKIKFTENNSISNKPEKKKLSFIEKRKTTKQTLFESDEESDGDVNFEVKQTFEGKDGKKLFELQSRYKNDKRFILDERFVDNENNDDNGNIQNVEIIEPTLEDEKKKQFEILDQVLGSTTKPKLQNSIPERSNKGMLRFDPTQSDHSKYELKNIEDISKVKRKHKVSEEKTVLEENDNNEVQPTVSKDIFYKVSDDLKDTFQKEQSFSLLDKFGNYDETEDYEEQQKQPKEIPKKIKLSTDINPFKYDSSDDEDIEDIPNENLEVQESSSSTNNKDKKSTSQKKLWVEPFFFREDDYRFQEGLDFIHRIASEKNEQFIQLRRDLKTIVKAKVGNNQRKNKPFKKKLGGSKKKQMIRMKKAMKRH